MGDWRAFRRHQLALEAGKTSPQGDAWAHPLTALEPGCLLIARPNVLFAGRPSLNRGVVLVRRGALNPRGCPLCTHHCR